MPELIETDTERLRLTIWDERHIAPFAAMHAEPEVMRYFPATLTERQTREAIEPMRGQFAGRGGSLWVAECQHLRMHHLIPRRLPVAVTQGANENGR
ncbi:GNAT family N-acetyltransferase [Piscinibacter sakaiensis]|uniref:GNAT family N-acetyltransferase n=1 Tax=Piscinibacter sakaiensis TaxID=1547922 RepID=UPI003AAF4611